MSTLVILGGAALVIALVAKLGGNPVGHSVAFRRRRMLNWLPLGLTYAFLYMGRYNLTVVSKASLSGLDKAATLLDASQFGSIFGFGAATYGFAFLLNGPLTDRIGGRRAILLGAGGALIMNAVLGVVTYLRVAHEDLGYNWVTLFTLAYAGNMYFQSFGAVAIVKVNSSWFHVRERGSFGGIFGTLISLGIYFAFSWGESIVKASKIDLAEGGASLGVFESVLRSLLASDGATHDQFWWVFWAPSLLLLSLGTLDYFLVRDTPGQAGLADFETGDASEGDTSQSFRLRDVLAKILTNPTIWVIGSIEFCSGVLRNGVMHWYRRYLKETMVGDLSPIGIGYRQFFFYKYWGEILCVAGIGGGMFAGFISDKVFGSRRGPVAALLYGVMLICCIAMVFSLNRPWLLGALVSLMSLAVIGVHGMLSGTATMDFGGRKAAGTAVGVIDGFVYLGTAVQSFGIGFLVEKDWSYWPAFMLPFALIGLMQAIRIWKAFPGQAKNAAVSN